MGPTSVTQQVVEIKVYLLEKALVTGLGVNFGDRNREGVTRAVAREGSDCPLGNRRQLWSGRAPQWKSMPHVVPV